MIQTRVYDMNGPERPRGILDAASCLAKGGIVVFPTETVYGLGASAFHPDAVKRVYDAKGRPHDNPMIVHISGIEDLDRVAAEVPEIARRLAQKYWPGPLTMILEKADGIPDEVTAGLKTVGIRMPNNPVALALIKKAGPIAAPSANISGRPSPTQPEHVLEDMTGKADIILLDGACRVGVESTVLDLTTTIPCVYRPGYVTVEELSDVLGAVEASFHSERPRSPGQKYRHYAPDTEIIVVPAGARQCDDMFTLVKAYRGRGQRVGVMCSSELASLFSSLDVRQFILGHAGASEEALANLFALLRDADATGMDVVVAQGFDGSGKYSAFMDRLVKASGGNVWGGEPV